MLLAVTGVLLAVVQLASSSSKLCCDPDCSREYGRSLLCVRSLVMFVPPLVNHCLFLLLLEPISLARSRVRHLPKDKQFLSFPARASITVLAKNVGNEDIWEGKVRQRKHCVI